MAKKKAAPKRAVKRRPTLIQQSRRVPAIEKAAFHQVSGAGRSRVKRQFVGLTPEDEDAIVDRIDQALAQAVKEA